MPRFTAALLALASLSATPAISIAQTAYQTGQGTNYSQTQSSVPNGYVSAADAYPQSSAPAGTQNEAQIAAQNYRGPNSGPADGGNTYADPNNGNLPYAQDYNSNNQQPSAQVQVQQPNYQYGQQQPAYSYRTQQAAPPIDSAIQYPAPAAVAVAPYPYPYAYGYPYPYYRPYVGVGLGFGYGGYRGYYPYRGYVGGYRGGYVGGFRGGYAGGGFHGRR